MTDVIEADVDEVEPGKVLKYRLFAKNQSLGYRDFINALNSNARFRQYFNHLLAKAPYASYRFETPALSLSTVDKPFEFVLIDAPGLHQRSVDPLPFKHYITNTNPDSASLNTETSGGTLSDTAQPDKAAKIVTFKSLGADATLIVPSPRASHNVYNHIASFTRAAPQDQTDALWLVVGQELRRLIGSSPLWLNTEGSGVAWLHVRIDARPKYYSHQEYKSVTGGCAC